MWPNKQCGEDQGHEIVKIWSFGNTHIINGKPKHEIKKLMKNVQTSMIKNNQSKGGMFVERAIDL